MNLVTINRLGALRGLQFKPGKGFNLRKMGAAKIVRISEVLWSDAHQRWYVKFLRGELTGCILSDQLWGWADKPAPCVSQTIHGVLYFAEYDDAVAMEVAVVQALRQRGYRIA